MQTHGCLSGHTSRVSLHSLHTTKLIAIKKTMNEAVRPYIACALRLFSHEKRYKHVGTHGSCVHSSKAPIA